MENNCGIYCITNILNNKKYIGSSVNLERRLKSHFYNLRTNIHKNPFLQSTYNKYDKDIFKQEILEYCSKEILIEKEIFYIKLYNTFNREFGYNLDTPKNSNLGYKQGERTIFLKKQKCQKKINQFDLKGNFIKTWDSIKEASDFYKVHSSCIIGCCKRKPRYRTSCKSIWRYFGDNDLKTNQILFRYRKVFQYDLNNNFITEFKTLKEAHEKTGINKMSICRCVNNKQKQTMNFKFIYDGY